MTFPMPTFTPVPGASIPTDAFITTAESATNGSSFTFSSTSIGTAHSSRYVVVGCGTPSPSSNPTVTATLGGNSMTEIVQEPLGFYTCYLFGISVASGTSADIVLNLASGTWTNMQIGVWALYDLSSTTPTATNSERNAATMNLNCNVVSPGIAIIFTMSGGTNTLSSLTGVNTDFNTTSSESIIYGGGMSTGLSTETPRTLTATWTGTGGNTNRSVAATWQKN